MNDQISIKELKSIEKVTRVYSGKPGCACGCRGKYYPNQEGGQRTTLDSKMIKKIHALFISKLNEAYTWEKAPELACLDTNENRTYTLYFKEEEED